MAGLPKLSCLSILICDQVFRDELSKKQIIVGTYNTILTAEIPCSRRDMEIMFSLTGGHGEYDLALEIEHERTGHEVVVVRGPFKLDDPLAVVDTNVKLGGPLVFPEEGKYWVSLKAEGEILVQRPLFVRLVQNRAEELEQG